MFSDFSTTRRLTHQRPICFDAQHGCVLTLLKTNDSDRKYAEGGLRLRGLFKKSTDKKPLVSIVTVVYNGDQYLEETINSVIGQTYGNVEYIVVDGGSTDATLDIIRKYEDVIDYWVSEQDKGLYDAMNKGIKLASGKWINFMNCGDCFFNYDVLNDIFSGSSSLDAVDVIYGNHEVSYGNRCKMVEAGQIENIWKGSQFCHQSAFVNAMIHKANPFSLKNKIVSDFKLFYDLVQSGKIFIHLDVFVSKVSSGGLSDKRRFLSIYERFGCLDNKLIYFPYYLFVFTIELIKLPVLLVWR